MALIVGITPTTEDDAEIQLIGGDGGHLFGFESTRSLWSEPRFNVLGLKFLPQLKDDNLHLRNDELDELLKDLLMAESIMIGDELEFWRFRFNNVRNCIRHIRDNKLNTCLFIG